MLKSMLLVSEFLPPLPTWLINNRTESPFKTILYDPDTTLTQVGVLRKDAQFCAELLPTFRRKEARKIE